MPKKIFFKEGNKYFFVQLKDVYLIESADNYVKLYFNDRKALVKRSLSQLEEAGYIACSKSFEGRRPRSEYRLTPVGRKALHRYLEHIEAVIKATRRA